MSSTRAVSAIARAGRRRRKRILALTTALAVTAAGCGFQPIHGQRSEASGTALAAIDIGLIADRTGQMLRNELLQQMQPQGGTTPARYGLAITLGESLQELAIRKDETATRTKLIMTARFSVTSRADGKGLFTGSVQSANSYDILTSDFATLSAREDARRRAVQQLATGIKQRLSVWLVQTGGRAPLP
jgi:LPS-assembly lipoprotein